MSARVLVKEMIEVFRDTYHTIDIRSAAVHEGDAWVNTITVVRLTYEELEVATERLRQLEQTHGQVRTEHFHILTLARPFSQWDQFREEVGNGILRFGGLEVRMRQGLVVDEQGSQLQPSSLGIRPFDSTAWPAVRVQVGQYQGTELMDGALAREVGAVGYPDVCEAINALGEVDVRLGQWYGYSFNLSLPVFAQVVDARVVPTEKRLHVTLRRHHKLEDIKGIVILRGIRSFAGEPHKARMAIGPFSRSEGGSPIENATAWVGLREIDLDDLVDIRLIHPRLGEVDGYFSRMVRSLIPPAERNILFEALRHFCPDAKIEELLIRPFNEKPKKLKTSAAFEHRVAWLLGLLGLPTIVLGEYERLSAPETKVELGSVDILALTPGKTLLLVACTLTAPEDKDFNQLRNVRGILEREAFKDTTCRILPVVFTASAECLSYKEEGLLDFIPIVNAEGMATVLALLRIGAERGFFEFLNNPTLSPLKKPSEE